jgi:hypothetical protein
MRGSALCVSRSSKRGPSFVQQPSQSFLDCDHGSTSSAREEAQLAEITAQRGLKTDELAQRLCKHIHPAPSQRKKGHEYPRDPLGRNHYLPVSAKDTQTTLVLVGCSGWFSVPGSQFSEKAPGIKPVVGVRGGRFLRLVLRGRTKSRSFAAPSLALGQRSLDCARDSGARLSSQPALSN